MIKKILRSIFRLFRLMFRLNILKTVYFNFKMLPFQDAIRFPFFLYGNVKLHSLQGKVIIDAPIKTGMIKIGVIIDHMPTSCLPVQLKINNVIKFNGYSLIGGGSVIEVWRDGYLELGKYTRICSGAFVQSLVGIKLGDYSWITAECIVMDSNIHYMLDVSNGKVSNNKAPIIIGSYCWIIMRSVVSKGTILPDYCVVARNSLLNKDYSKNCNIGSLLAGNPAKVIKTNIQYIPNYETEKCISLYFKENKCNEYYQMKPEFIKDAENSNFSDFKNW